MDIDAVEQLDDEDETEESIRGKGQKADGLPRLQCLPHGFREVLAEGLQESKSYRMGLVLMADADGFAAGNQERHQ